MSGNERWLELNQLYLTAALKELAVRLGGEEGNVDSLTEIRASMADSPAIESLAELFGLSPFERDVVLMCAGVELDSSFALECSRQAGGPQRPFPTFGFALAKLRAAHWSALSPAAPLRHWRLVEFASEGGITEQQLRIDERILHHLAGIRYLDERLAGLIEPVRDRARLVESHRALVLRAAALWRREGGGGGLSAIQLTGSDPLGKRQVAIAICAALGLELAEIAAAAVPAAAADLDNLLRAWWREAALTGSALLIECDDLDGDDRQRQVAIGHLVDGLSTPVLVSSPERRPGRRRPLVSFAVERPLSAEQRQNWLDALGAESANLDGLVDRLVGQFRLSSSELEAAAHEGLAGGSKGAGETPPLSERLWAACRRHARPRLEQLAQRIDPVATWDDLVLPQAQRRGLRELAIHARRRLEVYEEWGFAAKSARGLGISALFAGVSGTGKTMAAEVLANELRLDLYRIDLAGVVSKYIGETEKNLRRVFDAAETGGAILLFDEADALFGKRSEVKDSHDRYANIEVSYLLQRMEAYQGLAILTSNMKSALDAAFLRRLRFVIEFPFPDAAARVLIWRRIFPAATPTDGLDPDRLAQLNVAGGNIRNIALNGAFLASDQAEPVRMSHLLEAARAECKKLERPLSETEIRGWLR